MDKLDLGEHEIESRREEFGILNTQSESILWCKSQSEAEFDALLYPSAVVVRRIIYSTKPVVILTSS